MPRQLRFNLYLCSLRGVLSDVVQQDGQDSAPTTQASRPAGVAKGSEITQVFAKSDQRIHAQGQTAMSWIAKKALNSTRG